MLKCCSIERGKFSEHEPGGIAPAKDFTGVRMVSAVNSLMIKRALIVVAFLALCFPWRQTPSLDASSAFAFYRPEIFSTVNSLALVDRLPVLNFLDGTRLPVSSEMGRMGTAPVEFPSLTYMSVACVSAAKRNVNAAPGIRKGWQGFVR